VQATFFVLGYVADKFPDLIRRVAEGGHEIGLHGYYHFRVDQSTSARFEEDLLRGKAVVEQACGAVLRGFRAPMWSINGKSLWALEILAREGFVYDASVFPTRNMLYGYPSAPRAPYYPLPEEELIEIPMSTVKLCGLKLPISGGFYLRLLPYGVLKWGLRRINREGLPGIVYLHPWDLDPGQPLINPTPRERITHYYNLSTTERKLKRLLMDFSFAPMIEIIQKLPDWRGTSHV
jgi:polysaccharide deacetylase family protein (PEP-CTERM system associated)